ncbi:MAG: 1-acyl-sn-glycerol-3-phosphate acyltransferase [Bacteroidetes bacterium]|nr:1-acyl-sn-glycerol-3-phosphate acyltransferase [Bacteroidota bacterium]
MGIIGEIFGRIWAVWALLLFVSTLIIFLIPFLLFSYFRSDPAKTKIFIKLARVWMDLFLTLSGCPVSVKGKSNFKKGETYIVVCNHNSFMDIPVSSTRIPGGNKTIAKIELSRIPVFGLLYKTGSVLVDRKSETSRRDSFTKMKDVLNMGLHMCIYPEGTRNKTGQPIKSFHDGAFRLAIASGKKIMPAVIFNSRKAMPFQRTFFLLPYQLRVHFLEPISPQPSDDVESLKQKVFAVMSEYYSSNTK